MALNGSPKTYIVIVEKEYTITQTGVDGRKVYLYEFPEQHDAIRFAEMMQPENNQDVLNVQYIWPDGTKVWEATR